MIAREWRAFLAAVQFLTRLPIQFFSSHDAADFHSSAKYFSLVGALIGGVAAAVLLAATIVFPQPAPVILALAAGVALTGALHEDGLADAADGLFGGRTRERRLEIMKDSRIGVFGALALAFVIALKAAALTALDPLMAALSLVAAHAGARAAAVAAMGSLPYAGDAAAAKLKQPRVSGADLGVALAVAAIVGLATLQFQAWLIGTVIAIAAASILAGVARRLVGGQTGDILGAVEQLFEAGFLLGAASVIAGPG